MFLLNPMWLNNEKKSTQTLVGFLLTLLLPIMVGVYIAYLIILNNNKSDIQLDTFKWLDYDTYIKYYPKWNSDIVDITNSNSITIIDTMTMQNAKVTPCVSLFPSLFTSTFLPVCPLGRDKDSVSNGIGFGVRIKPNILNVGFNDATGVGANGVINDMLVYNNDIVVVVGEFAFAGNKKADSIAMYNHKQPEWKALTSVNVFRLGSPTFIANIGNKLYVAGNTLRMYYNQPVINGIVVGTFTNNDLTTVAWSGAPQHPDPRGCSSVSCFTYFTAGHLYNNALYLAFKYNPTPTTVLSDIFIYDGASNYIAIQSSLNISITKMHVFKNNLYVAGHNIAVVQVLKCTLTSPYACSTIWSQTQPNTVTSLNNALKILAMASGPTYLYFAGNVPNTNTVDLGPYKSNYIASYDGNALCTSLTCITLTLDNNAAFTQITTMSYFNRANDPSTSAKLYIGGSFDGIDGDDTLHFAYYDSDANSNRWRFTGDYGVKNDKSSTPAVLCMAAHSQTLYFGGLFKRTAKSVLLNNIGTFDGFNFIVPVGTSTGYLNYAIQDTRYIESELVRLYVNSPENSGEFISIKLKDVLPQYAAAYGASFITLFTQNTFAHGINSYKYSQIYGNVYAGDVERKKLYSIGAGGSNGYFTTCSSTFMGIRTYDTANGIQYECCFDPNANVIDNTRQYPSSYEMCRNSLPAGIPFITGQRAPVWMTRGAQQQYIQIAPSTSEFIMFQVNIESLYTFTTVKSGKDSSLSILGQAAGLLSTIYVIFKAFKEFVYYRSNKNTNRNTHPSNVAMSAPTV